MRKNVGSKVSFEVNEVPLGLKLILQRLCDCSISSRSSLGFEKKNGTSFSWLELVLLRIFRVAYRNNESLHCLIPYTTNMSFLAS